MQIRKNIKLSIKKKTKRGKRNGAKHVSKSMRFVGINAAGLGSKLSTFRKVLLDLRTSMFFVEETIFKEEGKLKVNNFITFEHVRESKDGGGGLALGCIKDLKPVLIRKGSDG